MMPVPAACPLEPYERPNKCKRCPLSIEEKIFIADPYV